MITRLALLLLVLLCGFGLAACRGGGEPKAGTKTEQGVIAYYTCPMHPQIHEDHPGECPICHMKLVPVYEQPAAPAAPAPAGGGHDDHGTKPEGKSITITPERQQLIGVKTAPAVKQAGVKEFRAFGQVAFDQALAMAQREYVEIARNVPELKTSAASRLTILGMSAEEIRELERRGRVNEALYLPKPDGAVWVYATLYESEMNLVPVGTEAAIALPSAPDQTFTGTVRAVDPVVQPMSRSVRARIEVPGAGGRLRPESYVTVRFQIPLAESVMIPKSAVIDTGTRQVAFVVHDGTRFEARDLQLGPAAGDDVVVIEGLQEGETVVTSAAFLVDSESQLKAAVSGGHQH